jgi:flagellar assembly factor FliW
MNDATGQETITFQSSRFGELSVPASSIIEFPSGLVGFPRRMNFVMLDYTAPFSWLHSIEDPSLAFVVVDGFEFGRQFNFKPPIGDKEIDLKEDDEFAILVIVTVRPDPKLTTANLKAPVFVNVRTRKGIQVIYDNPTLSTRYLLWGNIEGQDQKGPDEGEKSGK